jgi:hypothetical protein
VVTGAGWAVVILAVVEAGIIGALLAYIEHKDIHG